MAELRGRDRIGVAELADRLGIDARQARRAVQSLAQRGLVRVWKEPARLKDGRSAPVKMYVWAPTLDPERRRAIARSVRDFTSAPPVGRVVTNTKSVDAVAENRAALKRQLSRKSGEVADVVDLDERRK